MTDTATKTRRTRRPKRDENAEVRALLLRLPGIAARTGTGGDLAAAAFKLRFVESERNVYLVLAQRPDATDVRPHHLWREAGRKVKTGDIWFRCDDASCNRDHEVREGVRQHQGVRGIRVLRKGTEAKHAVQEVDPLTGAVVYLTFGYVHDVSDTEAI